MRCRVCHDDLVWVTGRGYAHTPHSTRFGHTAAPEPADSE